MLLLEAGGEDRNIWLHIPLGYGKHFTNPEVNWLYQTEPEPECHGRQIIAPRGKVLGGSSSINGLMYMRGQAEDYDRWRQLGNAGWGYADVLPYFRKAEDQERGADEWHGEGGPLAVSDHRSTCRSATRSSRPPSSAAIRAIRTSTAPPRKASATTSSPRATAGAARRRSAI